MSVVAPEPLLDVRDLTVSFRLREGKRFVAVDRIGFTVHQAQTLALVGESGCGKTVTGLAMLRLINSPPGRIEGGSVRYRGRDLMTISDREMRKVRGSGVAMIFQEPVASLNPVIAVGEQLVETAQMHLDVGRREALDRAEEALAQVGMPRPREILRSFPHELSGGMCQRVMIAMSLIGRPGLLIADEPTTALDVTIQRQILELLADLRRQRGLAMLLVTHDLGVVTENADTVAVMYGGCIVEYARVSELFERPFHPYTRGLFGSVPRLAQRRDRLRSVSEFVGRAEAFQQVPGARYGVVPWWPHHAPPPETGTDVSGPAHVLHEVAPEHWVRCWATPYVQEHPIRLPDLPPTSVGTPLSTE